MPAKKILKRRKTKPQFMVTYLCHDCGFDFALTELDKPKCFYCEGTKNYSEIKRKKLSLKVIVERMTLCNNRMLENLRKAYDIRPEDEISDEDMDTIMLEAMAKGQSLGKMIEGLKRKKEGRANKTRIKVKAKKSKSSATKKSG